MVIVGVLVAAVIGAACSGGGGGSKATTPSRPAACAYVTKLDQIADAVATANVDDPDTFNATLETAVTEYVANVQALQRVAPTSLHASLELVAADVQQHRFAAAATDRADLDTYAQRECGRAVALAPTATTSGPTTSAPSLSTTTLAPGSTAAPTTAPSDG
jgi:hypothetical protein